MAFESVILNFWQLMVKKPDSLAILLYGFLIKMLSENIQIREILHLNRKNDQSTLNGRINGIASGLQD